MESFGRLLAGLGLISAVLSFVNYELTVLLWIDSWGTGIGWLIRIALFVAGAALVALPARREDEGATSRPASDAV